MDARRDNWVWGWRVCRALALLFFLGAVLVGMGWAQIDHADVFVPAGLFWWCLSNLW